MSLVPAARRRPAALVVEHVERQRGDVAPYSLPQVEDGVLGDAAGQALAAPLGGGAR